MAVANSEALTAAVCYLDVLHSHDVPVCGVVLYGSHARGEATPDSDIDLLVVLDDDIAPAKFRCLSAKLWGYITEADIRIEPKAVRRSQYQEDDSSPLLEIIRREGIPVGM